MNLGARGRDTNERGDMDEVDPAMVRLLEWGISLTGLYRWAAVQVLLSDRTRAWGRREILAALLERGLVPVPGNMPVLGLALADLVHSGEVVRVVTGWYRVEWRRRESADGLS